MSASAPEGAPLGPTQLLKRWGAERPCWSTGSGAPRRRVQRMHQRGWPGAAAPTETARQGCHVGVSPNRRGYVPAPRAHVRLAAPLGGWGATGRAGVDAVVLDPDTHRGRHPPKRLGSRVGDKRDCARSHSCEHSLADAALRQHPAGSGARAAPNRPRTRVCACRPASTAPQRGWSWTCRGLPGVWLPAFRSAHRVCFDPVAGQPSRDAALPGRPYLLYPLPPTPHTAPPQSPTGGWLRGVRPTVTDAPARLVGRTRGCSPADIPMDESVEAARPTTVAGVCLGRGGGGAHGAIAA